MKNLGHLPRRAKPKRNNGKNPEKRKKGRNVFSGEKEKTRKAGSSEVAEGLAKHRKEKSEY